MLGAVRALPPLSPSPEPPAPPPASGPPPEPSPSSRLLASSVSRARYLAPQSQTSPAISTSTETTRKPVFMLLPDASVTAPITIGDITSPSEWMMRMLSAYAPARIAGCVTLARMVFVGPVLKNRQKQAMKMQTQAHGNGTYSDATKNGKPTSMAHPDTRKYEPGKRARSLSARSPPRSVAARPETTRIPPKMRFTSARFSTPRYS